MNSEEDARQSSEKEIEEFRQKVKELIKESIEDVKKYSTEIEEYLKKYGSIPLLSQIILQEIRAQSPSFHDPSNPMGENPFGLFLSGLFLKYNNLNAKAVHPYILDEIVQLLTKYFASFRLSLMTFESNGSPDIDSLIFKSKQEKILSDGNPRSFPEQKIKHVKEVFIKIDDYFTSKWGFSIDDVILFSDLMIKTRSKLINEKLKLGKEKFEQAKNEYSNPKNEELRKRFEEQGISPEDGAAQFAEFCFLLEAETIFTINLEEFCTKNNITKKKELRGFLSALSCEFGKQFTEFTNPLSDNILSYKPFIKIDEDNYFCPLLTSLIPKLDICLEYMLNDEKDSDSSIWKKYESAKSKFLENKTFECFSRIFPTKNMYQNIFYRVEDRRLEADLLIVYDNKIVLVESKSNHLPLSAKRGGVKSLEQGLKKIIRKAYLQAKNTRNYIQSSDTVSFEDESGKEILKINNKENNFQFILVNSTLEVLDSFAANLKELDALELFEKEDYPWSVNLYDLDVITDCISNPAYFLHYIHQRLMSQKKGIFRSITEGEFLGYYFKNGNFYEYAYDTGRPIAHISLAADFFDPFEKYYVFGEEKPSIKIERILDELIKNMTKYQQKGFTDIVTLLLDFPLEQRKLLARAMEKKFNKTIKTGKVDGKTMALPTPYDIGFSYFTSPSMTKEFYQFAKLQHKRRKYQQKITKWATIGRNVSDKKNFATFIIYENTPWEFNQELENDVQTIFGNAQERDD